MQNRSIFGILCILKTLLLIRGAAQGNQAESQFQLSDYQCAETSRHPSYPFTHSFLKKWPWEKVEHAALLSIFFRNQWEDRARDRLCAYWKAELRVIWGVVQVRLFLVKVKEALNKMMLHGKSPFSRTHSL